MNKIQCVLINCSASLFFAFAGALLFVTVAGELFSDDGMPAPKTVSALQTPDAERKQGSYAKILTSGFFGTDCDPGKDESAPDAVPRLMVLGTVTALRPYAMVLIRNTDDGIAGVYRTGDSVGDYRVAEIHNTRVTVTKGGKSYVLDMYGQNPPEGVSAKVGKTGSRKAMTVSRSELLQKCHGNPETIMHGLRAGPLRENDAIAGFKLYAFPEDSVLRDIGLQPNDVICRINGHPANSMEQLFVFYQNFLKESQVTLDIRRGDGVVTNVYTMVK